MIARRQLYRQIVQVLRRHGVEEVKPQLVVDIIKIFSKYSKLLELIGGEDEKET